MEQIKEKLLQFNRKTISIDELATLVPNKLTYEQFATYILSLENENILEMIRAKGRNSRTPSLAHRYRIKKQLLNEPFFKALQTYRIHFHNAINLDIYFQLGALVWQQDFPYIQKINDYITTHGFPDHYVPAPERSFEIIGDEKWIEQTGEEILHKIQLWDKLKIMPVADPLMFALNPNKLTGPKLHHLIVENKTTYQALLPVLTSSMLTTIIYGAGSKIEKSIENFDSQLPIETEHVILYFGDIDREGINIWYRLNKKRRVTPALPFYQACLTKEKVYGKTNQTKNEAALHTFLTNFPSKDQQVIEQLLTSGAYYPQEALKTNELQQILLHTNWIKI